MALPDDVRTACARVAGQAIHVRVAEDAIERYARTIEALPRKDAPPEERRSDHESRAAFSLQLNAINFGSGWFPTLRKPDGLSGFRTVEAGVRANGPWTAAALVTMDAARVARALRQDPGHELMSLFASALNELGDYVLMEFGGSFLALARSGGGSAVALAERHAALPTWSDVSPYAGGPVPFFKRAQIAAADLHHQGLAGASDLARLTLFADNLVPHVLRIDGVLEFAPHLVERLDREQLIERHSPQEVEIRACAVHAVELLAAANGVIPAEIDQILWDRGAGPRYKAHPRHRSRGTAY